MGEESKFIPKFFKILAWLWETDHGTKYRGVITCYPCRYDLEWAFVSLKT